MKTSMGLGWGVVNNRLCFLIKLIKKCLHPRGRGCIFILTTPTTPLYDAHHGGFFMAKKIKFSKPPLVIDEQIDLLQQRGLVIDNKDVARHFLQFVSYYRLSQYTYTFEFENSDGSRTHVFKENTHFSDIVDLYVFDSKLRTIVMDAIERIEIAFRTSLIDIMSTRHGSLVYG